MTEPWQWVLGCLAALLVGLSKTGISGLSMVAVVLFASILPARESVGIVLIVLLAGDVVAVAVYWRDADWGQLIRIFPWAAVGVAAGAVIAGRLSDSLMHVLIGAIVVGLVLLQYVRSRTPAPNAEALPAWVMPATGLLAGITTMVANAAGPLMSIYLVATRLPKLAFVGTAAWFFFAINLFKLPFSYSLGLISPSSLGLSLRMAPFAIIGALFGRRLISGIDQRLFDRLALGLSLIAGLRLMMG